MKRLLFFVLSCLCIISTLSAQVIPLWLKERPMSISQYIGIGSVPLTVSNFREAARLAATNEIASQISVTVESNSFLKTVDLDGDAKQVYEQKIKESLSGFLAECEIVDTYQSADEFFVFCKLDKDAYQAYISEKRKKAVQQGLDFFVKGKDAEANGEISVALSLYGKGMESVEPYLSLNLDGMYSGRYVNVASELFTAATSLFSGMAITSNVSNLSVQGLKTVREPLAVCLSKNGVVLPNVLMCADFSSGAGDVTPSVKTDHTGTATFYVTNVTAKDDIQTINVSIDKSFINQFPAIYRSLVSTSQLPCLNITLAVTNAITTAYFDIGTNDIPECERLVRGIFVNNYFEVVEDSNADLYIAYSTELKVGNEIDGEMYKLNECFCTLNIKIYNNKTQGLLSEYSVPNLRILVPVNKSSEQASSMCARELMKQFNNRLPLVLKNLKL